MNGRTIETGNLNLSDCKKLETTWAKQLRAGRSVDVKIKPIYDADNLTNRPDRFKIEDRIDGVDLKRVVLENFKATP